MGTVAVKVQIKNLAELQRAFARSPQTVEPILQRAIEASQFVLQKHTLKNDPVPWRTGNLLLSFRFLPSRLRGRWVPTADYAVYVHEPRKNYGGNPYMDKIVGKAQGDIDILFESALTKIVRALAE